jgi:NAD-dependent dihydropyrimidine dehydrogenase PreA subunit
MITTINPERCTGCGRCVEVCPLDTLRLNVSVDQMAPCQSACPAGVDIRGYLHFLNEGKLAEAASLVRDSLPFPAITGRICFHPCESACSRKAIDESVNINGLERFVGDLYLPVRAVPEPVLHAAKIAVIGSGPAGLSAAYFLRKMGYRVTVFEALSKLGGTLRTRVPESHLPRSIIDKQVKYMREMGVEFRTGKPLGAALTLDGIEDARFKILFIATGRLPTGVPRPVRDSLSMVDPETFQTRIPYIFAGGALVLGKVPVVKVIGAARQAALSIARFLGHDEERAEGRSVAKNLPGEGMEKKPREKSKAEWSADVARREATRCLHCGARAHIAYPDDCMTCFECELECPSHAITVHPFKEEFPPTIDYSRFAKGS